MEPWVPHLRGLAGAAGGGPADASSPQSTLLPAQVANLLRQGLCFTGLLWFLHLIGP